MVDFPENLFPWIADPEVVVYVRDMNGRFVWVNQAFQRDHDVTNEQMHGKTQGEFFGAEVAKPWDMTDMLTKASRTPTSSLEPYNDKGHMRYYLLTKMIVPDKNGTEYIFGVTKEVLPKKEKVTAEQITELANRAAAEFAKLDMSPFAIS